MTPRAEYTIEKIAGYWRLLKNRALVATFRYRHEARDEMAKRKRGAA